ncbi:MAG: ATP-binding protein [Elainellaceae cyanobacterium]
MTHQSVTELPQDAANLTNCDKEQIHSPGLIQPHGILLVLQGSALVISQVSDNLAEVTGRHPQEVLGLPLLDFLGSDQVMQVRRCLKEDLESTNPLKISIPCPPAGGHRLISRGHRTFDGIVHAQDDVVFLELEPKSGLGPGDFSAFYQRVQGTITRLQKSPTLLAMCQVVVQDIRQITGFDRVMVYKFDQDNAGSVVAEATNQDTAYLGLHYPATDIPQQARRLYALNWLRLIPDVNYQPVAITPPNNPSTGQPPDLSFAVLRSVSPLHLEYMQNMGVAASMSISLMQGRRLWGLIACHHSSPKHISYDIRTACQFVGQVMSAELVNKTASEDSDYKVKLKSLQTEVVNTLSQSEQFLDGMGQLGPKLLALVSATGAAVFSGGQCLKVGAVPEEEELDLLLTWIKPQIQQNLFETRSLSEAYSPAASYEAIASGVLALEISRIHHNFILWFRPEVIQTVDWGGEPNKPSQEQPDGSLYLTPRKSFDRWQETVRGCCLPWKPVERDAVVELRNLIVGIVLRQADELASMNIELQRSNDELDSFAYIASHDLKEPLRGIHNYASFLMEDYEDVLDGDGVSKLQTVVRLTQRMESLLNSLLHCSRISRAELVHRSVDIDQVVRQTLAMLSVSRPQSDIEFRLPRPLPQTNCDRSQINELFMNLISNAIKYNDKTQPWVEIGYIDLAAGETLQDSSVFAAEGQLASSQTVFYVRDNGIGISPSYFKRIFQIFQRLHERESYGGGTGVGLTIVQKIVERHSGKIWIESALGQGSTFCFTLAAEEQT